MASDPTTEPVGLIGTGLFGSALAERLLAAGYQVVVHNRTRSKAEPVVAMGAHWSDNPLSICRRVFFCLFTTDQVAAFVSANRSDSVPGQIILDTSTSDPHDTTKVGQELARRHIHYLETPFSGSSEQVRNHQATALVAGDQAAFDACQDLWRNLAAAAFYLGVWGNAAKMKLATNLVLGLNRAALAEGLIFAETVGLSKEDALRVLLNSPAYSRIMEAKGPKMVHRDFTPQAHLAQHAKDVRLMLANAAGAGASLPLSETHLQLLEEAVAAGLGDLDNSAILRAIENRKP